MNHKIKSRILFILKDRVIYGQTKLISYGLVNSCSFVVNTLLANDIESKIVTVPDNNSIDREVTNYKPTHVIIEALWVVPEKFKILAKLHPNVHWIIRLHSSIPFLAIEGISFEWIHQYSKLHQEGIKISIACNKKENVDELNLIYPDILFLPNIYNPLSKPKVHKKIDSEYINVGCFGALRPLKNTVQQAIWSIQLAKKYNKKLNFHINHSQHEKNYTDPVFKNLINLFKGSSNYNLINHHWVSHTDFLEIINQMDLGLQLSYTETFNIVAADFIYCDVPIVVSNEINWVCPLYQADPSNSSEVISVMEFAYFQKNKFYTDLNKRFLDKYNKNSTKIWLEYFTKEI